MYKRQVQLPKDVIVKSVSNYKDTNALVTTSVGLFIYDFDLAELTPFEHYEDVDYVKSDIQMAYVSRDMLFICYLSEIVKFNLKSPTQLQSFDTDFMITLDIRKWDDRLWFATSKGVLAYDFNKQLFEHGRNYGLSDRPALDLFVKSESEIWFSVIGEGVVRYLNEENLFELIKVDETASGSSKHNNVWSLNNDGDEIVVTTLHGIYFLNKSEGVESLHEAPSLNTPLKIEFSLHVSKDENDIWISTYDAGIYHFNLEDGSIKNYSESGEEGLFIGSNTVLHSLVLDGEVLFSTDNGLFRLDRKSLNMNEVDYGANPMKNILAKKVNFTFKDNRGRLWVATRGGLFIQESDRVFSYLSTNTNPALSNNRIRSIYQQSDSTYLIGTSSGVNILDDYNNTVRYIDKNSGLKNDVIYSLELDADGDIWVATNKGVSLIDQDGLISNFHPSDGLEELDFNENASMKDGDGHIYFGGISGISTFDPKKAKEDHVVRSPIITKLEVLPHQGESGLILSFPLKSLYEFSSAQCNYLINFTSVNYTSSDNNIFYYKLEGYNHEWVRVEGEPVARFMNLDAGTYDFKVRTAFRNGEMSHNIASVRIKINPAFYNSSLFRVILGLLLLVLGSLVYRARTRAAEIRNKKLERIVEKQTKQLKRANDLQGTFLKEVPEPLVIFDSNDEVIFANDLYDTLKFEHLIGPEIMVNSSQKLDDYIFAGVKELSESDDYIYESDLVLNDKLLQLKYSRMIVGDVDYGTAVLLRDVTRIRNAEKILKENEILFRSYFEKSPIGIVYVVDPQNPIVNCNETFCKMLGIKKEVALSKTMMELTLEDDLERDIHRFCVAFESKEQYLFEPNKRLVGADGQVLLTETHLTFIYDSDGNYQYLFGLVHDVTEQRESQENLMRARTKLVQSEKLAALGQITAGVAHEINNPVNFIYNGVNNLKSLISSLRKGRSDDVESVYKDIDEMIRAVEDGANRTAEIVKSLSLFTREDVTSQVEYNIISGIESTIRLLSNKLDGRITVERNYPYKDYNINCYPGQLNQVFMNVLLNAIDAINGQGSIDISIYDRQSNVDIIIADTGSGINPAIRNMIYEPFFSTKGPRNGTGLGLSISQSIIDKHDGRIRFEDNVPKGTRCIISLPV